MFFVGTFPWLVKLTDVLYTASFDGGRWHRMLIAGAKNCARWKPIWQAGVYKLLWWGRTMGRGITGLVCSVLRETPLASMYIRTHLSAQAFDSCVHVCGSAYIYICIHTNIQWCMCLRRVSMHTQIGFQMYNMNLYECVRTYVYVQYTLDVYADSHIWIGLVPPRVICEVGDGSGWPISQITRGGSYNLRLWDIIALEVCMQSWFVCMYIRLSSKVCRYARVVSYTPVYACLTCNTICMPCYDTACHVMSYLVTVS